MNRTTGRSEERSLLRKLQIYGFTLYDTALFLDTHPEDSGALDYYDKTAAAYAQARREYEEKFGPLTVNGVDTDNGWAWTASPWPWEYEAN